MAWCDLAGISVDTGRRKVARGEISVVEVSQRRLGVTVGEHKRHLKECARKVAR